MKTRVLLLNTGSGKCPAAFGRVKLWLKACRVSVAALVLVLTFTSVFGQWKIMVIGGPSFTTFGGDDKKYWGGTSSNPKMVIRYQVGGMVNYAFSDKLSLESGIRYSAKGTKYSDNQGVEYNKVLGYLDVPAVIGYAIAEKFGLMVGPQISFLLSAKIKNSKEAQDLYQLPATEDVKDNYNSTDIGILAAPYYLISDKFAFRIEYIFGLSKIAHGEEYNPNTQQLEDKDFKVSNRGVVISLIYTIKQ